MRSALTCWVALLACIGISLAGPEAAWLCLGADGHVRLKVAPMGACDGDEPDETTAARTGSADTPVLGRSHGPCVPVPLGGAIPLGRKRSVKRIAVDSGVSSNVATVARPAADAAAARLVGIGALRESPPPASALIATVVLLI